MTTMRATRISHRSSAETALLDDPATMKELPESSIDDYADPEIASMYMNRGQNPINLVDPSGLQGVPSYPQDHSLQGLANEANNIMHDPLQTRSASWDSPSQSAVPVEPENQPNVFLESNDISLSGHLSVRMFLGTNKRPWRDLGLSIESTYEINNNYLTKSNEALSPEQVYPLPKNAGAGFTNSTDIDFEAGVPFSINDAKDKPISNLFNDFIVVKFKGTIKTKQPCQHIVGNINLIMSGFATMNGVYGSQTEKPYSQPFEVGDKSAKTKVSDFSGSHSDKKPLGAVNVPLLFNFGGGEIDYTLKISGTTYKQ